MIGQDQTALAQGGKEGILVDDAAVYQARVDMARMAGLPTPEQYYVDPQSQQAQQAAQAMAQQAQQAQEMQMQQQKETMRLQSELMVTLEQVKAEAKIQAQQMSDRTDLLQKQMDLISKTMDQRIKMAEIDASVDGEEGKREVELLQIEAMRKAKTDA
jgi:beta-phosphoglucomutase-like phosphatase (HAD superfamily)